MQYFSSYPFASCFPLTHNFTLSTFSLSAKAWSSFQDLFHALKHFMKFFLNFQAAKKCFTRNLKKFFALSFGCHAEKSVLNTNMSLTLFAFRNIQQSGNAFLAKEERKSMKPFKASFSLFYHFRCVKCDECSRLARSRRTRFDCSYFICNCLHCSSDNLSKAFT